MIRLKAALSARHSTPLAVLAVGASFGVVAIALAVGAASRQAPEDEAGVLRIQLHPPLVAPEPLLRQRCTTCGVIEKILVTEGDDGKTLSYDFEIRMQDGSLRHSSDTRPGNWQVGEGIQLLGGGRTWSER